MQHFPSSFVPQEVCTEERLSLCMGTRGSFKRWDTGDGSGEEMKESLITVGVHLGFSSDAGRSGGGNKCKPVSCPVGCHECLFASLPDYSPCAVMEKSQLCHHCKSYRPL